jgi:hypothetical protein
MSNNDTAVSDCVQNRTEIADRLCTQSSPGSVNCSDKPLFFIGSSPSLANKIISPDHPSAGVALTDSVQKRVPPTAGAGNGQGRKPKLKSKTAPIRIPEKYHPRVRQLVSEWEEEDNQ